MSETSNSISMRMSNNNRIKCSYPGRNATSHERGKKTLADTCLLKKSITKY